MKSIPSIIVLSGLLGVATAATGQHEDLRHGQSKPRIGQISDEVARRRLEASGVEQPRVISREGTVVTLQGMMGGRPAVLTMDAVSGDVRDVPDASVSVPSLNAPAQRPMVAGPQLVIEGWKISDPTLMRDAVRAPTN